MLKVYDVRQYCTFKALLTEGFGVGSLQPDCRRALLGSVGDLLFSRTSVLVRVGFLPGQRLQPSGLSSVLYEALSY